jgi:thiol-disulfide isomerase/thioredoxin
VVQEFGGKVKFAEENYGDSELAARFGVKRYPAIFVGDVLVATPKDFGWYGKGEGEGEGRYAPLKSAETHERFRADLRRSIAAMLAGRADEARAAMPAQSGDAAPRKLPRLDLVDLEGRVLRLAGDGGDLAGKVVAVELWATWCPPCRGTLSWLAELRRRFGDQVAVVTVAVESDAADVRKLAAETGHPFRWAMGTPEIARAFGDVSAVPTLLLFDRGGRAAGAFYGVPPGLHEEAEAAIQRLTADEVPPSS